ncbi:MAG TPA: thymidylate synthase [Candidatus Paceibacterota bacterium]|nr:thymidylate synthase [Candidatus Paceibacterota bacterium]
MNDIYKSLAGRTPDTQFRNLCRLVLRVGVRSETQQSRKKGEKERATYSIPYPVVSVYPIDNGFPMETARRIGKAGISESLALLVNGVRMNDELNREWGVPFWNSTFADPEKCRKRGLKQGDLGPASYAVLSHFPMPNGGTFNQIQAVLAQIREYPHLKTHIMTTLYPPGIYRCTEMAQQVVTVPCHGNIINILIQEGKLHYQTVWRSIDLGAGEPHDRIGHAALWLAICHVLGCPPGAMSIVYLNAHYYENQRYVIEELVAREPRQFPTVVLRDPPEALEAFRKEHFEINGYDPHPAIVDIPVSP